MDQITLNYPEKEPEKTMFVSLDAAECLKKLHHELTAGGELLDRYEIAAGGERRAAVCVYRHHFFRAGNDLTATVTVDDFTGKTRVHWVSGGGSDSPLYDFDWGAADKLNAMIKAVIKPYEVKETEEGSK